MANPSEKLVICISCNTISICSDCERHIVLRIKTVDGEWFSCTAEKIRPILPCDIVISMNDRFILFLRTSTFVINYKESTVSSISLYTTTSE